MARIIKNSQLPAIMSKRGQEGLSKEGVLWAYCALDSMVTAEADSVIQENDTPESLLFYEFEMAQQAPALAMMLRGIRVDTWMKTRLLNRFSERRERIEHNLNRLATAAWGRGLNARSPDQLKKFFYEHMAIEPVKIQTKGVWTVSAGKEARETISNYFFARPFVNHIQSIIDLGSLIKILKSGVDEDGRMRMSYNVAATNTGRWSSSKNCMGTGTNAQNITPEMREMFIADEGMILGYADLEQAESRGVAYLSEDEAYIQACESGDLHTMVCREIWPNEGWTGDLQKDKELAESIMFDVLHTLRFMAKTSGHSTNYLISAGSLARKNKMSKDEITNFQYEYMRRYPGIPAWHTMVSALLQSRRTIINALGRKRTFFGRVKDDATLRKAVAYGPQSLVADILNLGLLRIFSRLECDARLIQVLGQIHDAVLFQTREEDLDRVVPLVTDLMTIPLTIHGRRMVIPVEVKVGYDWKNMAVYGSEKAAKLRRREVVDNVLLRPIADY